MRRPERARHTIQLDLFHPICPAPDWRRLPAEAREKATRLMARLLRERQQPSQSIVRSEGGTMSDKIKPHHLDRKAMLYVRQSSAHQVMHNQESRMLQYAMQDRLRELGWSRDRDRR